MTPEDLQALHDAIEKLRVEALFEPDEDSHSSQLSLDGEQYFLLALNALETAQRFVTLAKYAQMQKR